jgi:asparagine synthase (glutamine-hydrolysing)
MSAVAALWSQDGGLDAIDVAGRMGAALATHGPDAVGAQGDRAVALAWRGRHVVPEDPVDAQPLRGAGGALVIADARIDNRDELRRRLGLPCGAEPLPDSAYVLAAFETWGERCVDHLVGDFAFVVWDPGRRRLFAARDAMGVRPLHFHLGRGFVAVASMPAGLFAVPGVERRWNHDSLLDIVLLLAQPGTATLYAGIDRVPAGHTLTVDDQGHRLERYWRPDGADPLCLEDDRAYEEAFTASFEEAVRCRLRTIDGPIVSQLSSGFDSSSVTAMAAQVLAREGRTLVAMSAAPRRGWNGPVPRGRHADEHRIAAITAAMHPNVEHRVLHDGRELLGDLDAFTHAAEIPLLNLCNQSWLGAIFAESRALGARVMLGARGGNMSISYRGEHHLAGLARRGRWIELARELGHLRRRPGGSLKRGLRWALGPNLPDLAFRLGRRGTSGYAGRARTSAFHPVTVTAARIAERARATGWSTTHRPWRDSRAMRVAGIGRMEEAYFTAGITAVWGVQPLDPTQDRRLVELCLAIPDAQYFRDGTDRRLLRKMMARSLAPEVLDASTKGYQAADWYEMLDRDRAALLREVERIAGSDTASALLDLAGLRSDLETPLTGGWDRPRVITRYRLRLLRGVAMGAFIRRTEDAAAGQAGG